MVNLKEQHSEKTKRQILNAAQELFTNKGYDAVSIREIAKKAGCSHTTIYIYFKDKEALLYQLSVPPLLDLRDRMGNILTEKDLSPEERLKSMSFVFIQFCLENRNMQAILFGFKSVRVDEKAPELQVNQIRLALFNDLKQAVGQCLNSKLSNERVLTATRIYFYMLHGIVGTYQYSEETAEELMGRLTPTFLEAFYTLIEGLKIQGGKRDEN